MNEQLIIEYAREASKACNALVLTEHSELALKLIQLMGRIEARAAYLKDERQKQDNSVVQDYMDRIKLQWQNHDCNKDGCSVCEEYFYSKGWDGLAFYAGGHSGTKHTKRVN